MEAIGRSTSLLKSGAQDAAVYQELWQTVLGGQIWRGELINRRKDGSSYTEEMSIAPVADATGDVVAFVAVKRDITERNCTERALNFHARLGRQLRGIDRRREGARLRRSRHRPVPGKEYQAYDTPYVLAREFSS